LRKEVDRKMKRLLISVFTLLSLVGCTATVPAYPTPDRCLALHTMSLPECSPPSSLPEVAPVDSISAPTSTPIPAVHSVNILVDDFSPQPYQGETMYFFNRLEGDRGAVNGSILDWGDGQVTTKIAPGNSWGGVWMSLNHPVREGLPLNFSAILPSQILPAYQTRITGLTVRIVNGTPNRIFKLELKNGDVVRWNQEITLTGEEQLVSLNLPALGNINQLVWILDHAAEGDSVTLDSVSLTGETPVMDTATRAFVWSYGMLLNNWNPATGLVRDKAKDASGQFDAIQATGCFAAATAVAEQLGMISRTDAVQIVDKIGNTLLDQLPRFHGLWPHWVNVSTTGEISIVYGTEWSSVDTVIAAIGLLEAQSGLGMDTSRTEEMLRKIEWDELVTPNGISHGYFYSGDAIPYAWDVFGGESWLVELAYAASTGKVTPLAYPSPPTANGAGFIDELTWLFVPPPSGRDYLGTDWTSYRLDASVRQISYYPERVASSCFSRFGLFGLSAGEVPSPASVPQSDIYQAYGVGGVFSQANDGTTLGASVVMPHYSAMVASLHPAESTRMWDWLIANGHFSPLNNVESLAFPQETNCGSSAVTWNQLKGSWNLSLQTLGWGRYLAERESFVPILWQTLKRNSFLDEGYRLLATDGPSFSG
jgi:hypothetical protein